MSGIEDTGVEITAEDIGTVHTDYYTCIICKKTYDVDPTILHNAQGDPEYYCPSCMLNPGDAQKALVTQCSGCKGHRQITYSIESHDTSHSYCLVCYSAGMHKQDYTCVMCSEKACPDYTFSYKYTNIPGEPTFAKAICSKICRLAVQKMSDVCFKNSLHVACKMCDADLSKDKLKKRCSRCQVAWYCDEECQKQDWSRHKAECRTSGKKGTATPSTAAAAPTTAASASAPPPPIAPAADICPCGQRCKHNPILIATGLDKKSIKPYCNTCVANNIKADANYVNALYKVQCFSCKKQRHPLCVMEDLTHNIFYCADCYSGAKFPAVGCVRCGVAANENLCASYKFLEPVTFIISKATCSRDCFQAVLEGLNDDKKDIQSCQKCFTPLRGERLRCAQCKSTYYCNAKCQAAHWEDHKKICICIKVSEKTI